MKLKHVEENFGLVGLHFDDIRKLAVVCLNLQSVHSFQI